MELSVLSILKDVVKAMEIGAVNEEAMACPASAFRPNDFGL